MFNVQPPCENLCGNSAPPLIQQRLMRPNELHRLKKLQGLWVVLLSLLPSGHGHGATAAKLILRMGDVRVGSRPQVQHTTAPDTAQTRVQSHHL